MADNTFPEDWRDQPCFVVAIPKPLVPFVGGILKMLEQRGFWLSDTDYLHGYTATTELEECLMTTCLDVLLEKQDALYRLLNTSVFGQPYELITSDPLVVSPDIAPFVDMTVFDQDSIMGRLDRLTQLIDNSINGTETPLYTYDPSVKALLQGIIDALGTEDTDIGDLLTQLELIAGLLA
jgi:hypothetical protein